MKFGLNILNFGAGATPDSLRRWARFAEDTGFHLVMISDHVAITPDVGAQFPAPFYDPFLSLAWLAAHTTRVELGTTVAILPYRHPLLTARLAVNLDRLSGGRFILGVGVGWARQEFAALGVPFRQRGRIADEYLGVIERFLAGDQVDYAGHFVTFTGVETAPRPQSPTGLPIWVGGSSPAAINRAARFGRAWHPYRVRLATLRDVSLPRLRQAAATRGRPVPALCPRLTFRLTERALPDEARYAGQGTLDQVRADLRALEALGAAYVLLDTYDGRPHQSLEADRDWSMLARLAEQVLDLAGQTVR